jgi:hypothetical protein
MGHQEHFMNRKKPRFFLNFRKTQTLTRALYLMLGLSLSLIHFSSPAKAEFIIHKWENHHESSGFFQTKLEGLYYTTTTNFDANGSIQTPSGLQSYSRTEGDLSLTTGLSELVSLYGRLNWLSVNQNGTVRSGTGFGLGDQTLGLNFRIFKIEHGLTLHRRITRIDLQFQADLPAYNNTLADANRTPYLGDGSFDWTGGVFLSLPFHSENEDGYQLQAGGGYTYRSSGFSAAVPFNINFAYNSAKDGVTGLLGVGGVLSLRTDTRGVPDPLQASTGSANSLITGGTNSSLVQIFAKLGYQTSPMTEFFLTGAVNLWGQLAPGGFTTSLGIQKRFGGPTLKPALQNEIEYGKGNRGFVNYSLDAKVVKSNDRLNLIKIDKGNQEGVEVAQIFDIFIVKKDGSIGDAIARGEITSVKLEEAALEIIEYYKEVPIDEGFIAKRLAQ